MSDFKMAFVAKGSVKIHIDPAANDPIEINAINIGGKSEFKITSPSFFSVEVEGVEINAVETESE